MIQYNENKKTKLSYREEPRGGPALEASVLDGVLLGEVLRRLDGRLHTLHCREKENIIIYLHLTSEFKR